MFGNMMQQMKLMQKLMTDENFKAFMQHPKVQELFRDPSFIEAAKSKNQQKIMSHPKMLALKEDVELRELMTKVDLGGLF